MSVGLAVAECFEQSETQNKWCRIVYPGCGHTRMGRPPFKLQCQITEYRSCVYYRCDVFLCAQAFRDSAVTVVF